VNCEEDGDGVGERNCVRVYGVDEVHLGQEDNKEGGIIACGQDLPPFPSRSLGGEKRKNIKHRCRITRKYIGLMCCK